MTNPVQLRNKMMGVVLQEARKTAGKSLREAAEAIGITTGILSAFESGRRSVTLPELEALAYFYDAPIRHLLHGAKYLTKDRRENLDIRRLAALRQKMISTKLRQLRADAKINLTELSKKTEIPSRRIKAYENGDRAIPLPDLESLALGLHVEVDAFIEFLGPVGEWEMNRESSAHFEQLPSDIRRFASQQIHEPYLRLAMQLHTLPAARLREIAEALLDITL